jgi:hypothetical protein
MAHRHKKFENKNNYKISFEVEVENESEVFNLAYNFLERSNCLNQIKIIEIKTYRKKDRKKELHDLFRLTGKNAL